VCLTRGHSFQQVWTRFGMWPLYTPRVAMKRFRTGTACADGFQAPSLFYSHLRTFLFTNRYHLRLSSCLRTDSTDIGHDGFLFNFTPFYFSCPSLVSCGRFSFRACAKLACHIMPRPCLCEWRIYSFGRGGAWRTLMIIATHPREAPMSRVTVTGAS